MVLFEAYRVNFASYVGWLPHTQSLLVCPNKLVALRLPKIAKEAILITFNLDSTLLKLSKKIRKSLKLLAKMYMK